MRNAWAYVERLAKLRSRNPARTRGAARCKSARPLAHRALRSAKYCRLTDSRVSSSGSCAACRPSPSPRAPLVGESLFTFCVRAWSDRTNRSRRTASDLPARPSYDCCHCCCRCRSSSSCSCSSRCSCSSSRWTPYPSCCCSRPQPPRPCHPRHSCSRRRSCSTRSCSSRIVLEPCSRAAAHRARAVRRRRSHRSARRRRIGRVGRCLLLHAATATRAAARIAMRFMKSSGVLIIRERCATFSASMHSCTRAVAEAISGPRYPGCEKGATTAGCALRLTGEEAGYGFFPIFIDVSFFIVESVFRRRGRRRASSRCHASWCPSWQARGSWQALQRRRCQPEQNPWLYRRQLRVQQQRRQGASSKLSFWRAICGRLFVRARALLLCQERAAVNLPQEDTLSRDDAPCR